MSEAINPNSELTFDQALDMLGQDMVRETLKLKLLETQFRNLQAENADLKARLAAQSSGKKSAAGK